MVLRLPGLGRLPDVATVSRTLAAMDDQSVDKLRNLNRQQVLWPVGDLGLARITLDFDGSVLSTGRFAEGNAVGFNRKKKGLRSYYPLLCTLAQTGQVLDVWHRPGNVHDSNGAKSFILDCVREIRAILPRATIEAQGLEFTISVPFERFEQLGTLPRKLIQRDGRITRPQGTITLTMSDNSPVKSEWLHYLDILRQAA